MTSQNSDSKDKICLFMSRPTSIPYGLIDTLFGRKRESFNEYYDDFIPCQREKCHAWIPACDIYMDPVHEQGKTMQECPAFEDDCQEHRPYCAGYCALIFQQRRRS